ncbi:MULTISPECIES: universal stress protein [Arthrobacter]|uniref:Universal stress protein n=1 Tax=Arthrobacter terricola TaxID=2547396 RepID=A0A4R5KG53_9MICC|nr:MULTISPECIES: universal stress protein [Arthrobacter]MBT8161896.1 universal stress protein [Arthrobacter sp. GN70]TDF94276.1 universal stress protein [Arthrobacter terricola]
MASESFSGRVPLVLGVLPGQHPHVLRTARDLALSLAAPLVCAYVDEASYLVEWDPTKETHRMSLHPGKVDADLAAVRTELRTQIQEAAGEARVDWTLRLLAGDPARAIGRLADDIQASMIILGCPEPGLGHRISEAFNGSVATWLTRHQSRPVLLVPIPRHERRSSHDPAAPSTDRREAPPGPEKLK